MTVRILHLWEKIISQKDLTGCLHEDYNESSNKKDNNELHNSFIQWILMQTNC